MTGLGMGLGIIANRAGEQSSVGALLMGFEGADGSTTFVDESGSGHTVTAVGNAQIDTAQKKFGSSSLLLDGAGDYLAVPNSEDFRIGTRDYTVDVFLRRASNGTHTMVACLGTVSNFGWSFRIAASFGQLQLVYSTTGASQATLFGNLPGFSYNNWLHAAFVKQGSELRIYGNGSFVAKATGVPSIFPSTTSNLTIGAGASGDAFNGHLDELYIRPDVVGYTGETTYTIPTAPFDRP